MVFEVFAGIHHHKNLISIPPCCCNCVGSDERMQNAREPKKFKVYPLIYPILVNLKLFIKFGKKRKKKMLNTFEDAIVVCKLFLNFQMEHGK